MKVKKLEFTDYDFKDSIEQAQAANVDCRVVNFVFHVSVPKWTNGFWVWEIFANGVIVDMSAGYKTADEAIESVQSKWEEMASDIVRSIVIE